MKRIMLMLTIVITLTSAPVDARAADDWPHPWRSPLEPPSWTELATCIFCSPITMPATTLAAISLGWYFISYFIGPPELLLLPWFMDSALDQFEQVYNASPHLQELYPTFGEALAAMCDKYSSELAGFCEAVDWGSLGVYLRGTATVIFKDCGTG